ncbi:MULTISPECIES: ABC transporter permease [Thermocrispum]|jgi:oleandomycin transport system permease protein|uniref:Transport permease protein n=2 Tax=Thermocrispum agreste TaxID=37925 RepID=A0ABD6FDC4_9PSEU|nr:MULTISPECIES: ABC transporter permease [Thermocrispum]
MTATTTEAAGAPQREPELAVRVTPAEGVRQSLTLAWRSVVQVRHNPWELGDFSFQPIMFVLLFTFMFGGAIMGDWQAYLQFMLPGMLVMNMLFVTLYVGQGLNTDITKGVFDRLQSLPIARWAPLAGRILADQVKQAWSIFLVLVIGFVLGFSLTGTVGGLLAAIALLLGFALCFSWVSVLVGIVAKDPERVQIFGFTAMFPLTMVSNVFVPAATLPGWLKAFVDINPVSVISDAVRGLMLGGPVADPLMWSIVWALGFLVVFAPLSVWAFKRRLA